MADVTPSKIAGPLLPEQIAELRALHEAARRPFPTWASEQRLTEVLSKTLDALLSAAERGIAAGEEVEDDQFIRDYPAARKAGDWEHIARVLSARLCQMDKRAKASNRRADKAEADLAASKARIGELRTALAPLLEYVDSINLSAELSLLPDSTVVRATPMTKERPGRLCLGDLRAIHRLLVGDPLRALLTPTHPETER